MHSQMWSEGKERGGKVVLSGAEEGSDGVDP